MGEKSKFVFPEQINELILKRDELKRQTMARRIAVEKWKANLDDVNKELTGAKEKSAMLANLSEHLLNLLNRLHSKAAELNQGHMEKESIITQLKAFNKAQYDFLSDSKETNSQLSMGHQKFITQCNQAPWVPEKKQLVASMNVENEKYEQVLQQIRQLDAQIENTKQTLDDHKAIPFRQFCVQTLAFYNVQRTKLRYLWKTEMAKNTTLKRRLKELGPSQHDISLNLQNDDEENENNTNKIARKSQEAPKEVAVNVLREDHRDNVAKGIFKRPSDPTVLTTNNISLEDTNANRTQIVDYESSSSTPVVEGSTNSRNKIVDEDFDESVLENEEDNAQSMEVDSPTEVAESQKSAINTQKDIFPSQTEFIFGGENGEAPTAVSAIASEPIDGNPSFMEIMRSSFNAEGNDASGANFMELFGSNNDANEDGPGFNFNFGDFGSENNDNTANESSRGNFF